MQLSKRNMPASLSFAAGTLFGAIVMLIPFASAGHARSATARPAATERPAAASVTAPARSDKTPNATRENREQKKTREKDNDATCDVQLD